MRAKKLSISLQEQEISFLDNYRKERSLSRSAVIQEAIKLLQQSKLEEYYSVANTTIDENFILTDFDELENATW